MDWCLGHFHINREFLIGDTRFRCLGGDDSMSCRAIRVSYDSVRGVRGRSARDTLNNQILITDASWQASWRRSGRDRSDAEDTARRQIGNSQVRPFSFGELELFLVSPTFDLPQMAALRTQASQYK